MEFRKIWMTALVLLMKVGVQVLIREEHGFKAWLDGLGRVDWVVVGSSFHTNYLTSVLKL